MDQPPPALPRIFDPDRRRAAIRRSLRAPGDRFLAEDLAEDMIERIDFMRIEPGTAHLCALPGTALATALAARDFAVDAADPIATDEELPYPRRYDLLLSVLRLDRVNDLPGALIHMRRALDPGGIAIASFPGAGSLPRLRAALLAADGERPAARMHPMIDTRAAAQLMQRAGFARQVVDSRTLEVRYATIDRLVADLRAHGLANQLGSRPPALTRAGWDRARESFRESADRDGKVTERFELLTLTGWR